MVAGHSFTGRPFTGGLEMSGVGGRGTMGDRKFGVTRAKVTGQKYKFTNKMCGMLRRVVGNDTLFSWVCNFL